MPDPARIEELRNGQLATIAGQVAAAAPLGRSPSGVECVYWDQRNGIDEAPVARSGHPFWVSDGAGRVLILGDDVTVRARADRSEQVVEMATAEMAVLSEELRSLKERLKQEDEPELRARRRHLAKVATLLCSLKAHARGRVHGKGTLASQAAWIQKNRHLADDGPGSATTRLAVEVWEMTLSPGDAVTVEATFRVEPVPPGIGVGGGYRDRPTCVVARGARLVGQGDARPLRPPEIAALRGPSASGPPDRAGPRPRGRSPFEQTVRLVVCGVTVAATVYWLLSL